MLKLLIDTREKDSLREQFRQGVFDEIEDRGLPFGDYWAEYEGCELPLAFERKSIGDLFGTFADSERREREKIKLEKAAVNQFEYLMLIEGTLETIFKGYEHSKYSGETMLKQLATWRLKYGLNWHCFSNRREMAKFIEIHFDAVRRNWKK